MKKLFFVFLFFVHIEFKMLAAVGAIHFAFVNNAAIDADNFAACGACYFVKIVIVAAAVAVTIVIVAAAIAVAVVIEFIIIPLLFENSVNSFLKERQNRKKKCSAQNFVRSKNSLRCFAIRT